MYGNASEYLLRFLQVLQNKVARIVTRLSWDTGIDVLLSQVGWLSIRQLYVYHSLITVFKMRKGGKPEYLREKFRNDFTYKTRLATGQCFNVHETPKTEKSRKSYVHNTTYWWNSLSPDMRKTEKLQAFKQDLKKWIKINVPI